MWRHSLLAKALMVMGIFMLLSIPIAMIKGQVFQRASLKQDAAADIAASYSRSQTITGPFIYIPYQERNWVSSWNKELEKYEKKQTLTRRHLILTPQQLKIDSIADIEMRYRGIYGTPVYTSRSSFEGNFQLPDVLPFQGNDIIVGGAYLVVAVSDMRGIVEVPAVTLIDAPRPMKLGANLPTLDEHTMYLELGDAKALAGRFLPVEFALIVKGSQRMGFLPAADNFSLNLQSSWAHPRFHGLMLPGSHDITELGFVAHWSTNHLASAQAIACIESDISCLDIDMAMNIDFIEPVTGYSSVERTVKYSHLFILIIFSAFLLFEVLQRLRIHALQYILVGLAQAMFFLLVLALSEHIAFGYAYLSAATACIVLMGIYLRHVLQSARGAFLFSAALSLVYGFLYMTLLSEDYAFLMGTVLLFALLSVIMLATRRIDWHAYSSHLMNTASRSSHQEAG